MHQQPIVLVGMSGPFQHRLAHLAGANRTGIAFLHRVGQVHIGQRTGFIDLQPHARAAGDDRIVEEPCRVQNGEERVLQSAEHGAWRAWLTLTLDTPADFASAASVAHLFPAGKPRDNMEYSTLAQATITVPAAGLYLWGEEA